MSFLQSNLCFFSLFCVYICFFSLRSCQVTVWRQTLANCLTVVFLLSQATVPRPMRWAGFGIVFLVSTHWSAGYLLSDRSWKKNYYYVLVVIMIIIDYFKQDWLAKLIRTMWQSGIYTRVAKATTQRVMLLKQQESAEWAHILAQNSPAPSYSQLMTISMFIWIWYLCAELQHLHSVLVKKKRNYRTL